MSARRVRPILWFRRWPGYWEAKFRGRKPIQGTVFKVSTSAPQMWGVVAMRGLRKTSLCPCSKSLAAGKRDCEDLMRSLLSETEAADAKP